MSVFTFVASIRTPPEPTVFTVFDRLDEVFANLVSRGNLIALL